MAAPLHAQPRPAPSTRPASRPTAKPNLRVVEKPRRRLRTGPTVVLAGFIAFCIAFALVVAQTVLVQGQQRLDDLDRGIAEARQRQQELRLEAAQRSSPDRIVAAATALGMAPPTSITYVTPGADGGSDEGP